MLVFDKVVFQYPGNGFVFEADFESKDRITGILGMNGAGKSTLMRLLSGALEPQSGSIRLFDRNIAWADNLDFVKKEIFFLPAEDFLFDQLTLEQNFRLFCDIRFAKQKHFLEFLTILQAFGLDRYLKTGFRDCSTGTRKKAQIFLAIISQPKVLFLDEPYNGLDIFAIKELNDILTGDLLKNSAIYLSSHIVDIVDRLSDRVLILHDGKLRASLTKPFAGRLEDVYFEVISGV